MNFFFFIKIKSHLNQSQSIMLSMSFSTTFRKVERLKTGHFSAEHVTELRAFDDGNSIKLILKNRTTPNGAGFKLCVRYISNFPV